MALFIYGLADPDTQQFHYVGKTIRPRLRLHSHLADARSPRRPDCRGKKYLWIRGLLHRGKRPCLVILEEVSGTSWREREGYWVARLRREGHPLANVHGIRSERKVPLVSATLSPEEYAYLRALADNRGITPSEVVREILRAHILQSKGVNHG